MLPAVFPPTGGSGTASSRSGLAAILVMGGMAMALGIALLALGRRGKERA
jgi:hypothetical protein